MSLDNDAITFIADFLKQRSGLIVTKDKAYLLESRLKPLAIKNRFASTGELITALKTTRDENLKRQVTEAMTTNESSFFRDKHPFEKFTEVVLPDLIERNSAIRTFKIWCAAASTGQEPYSLAMTLKELEKQKLMGWRPKILGTDIDTEVLKKAREGVYTQFEVQRGLPITHLVRYFEQKGKIWQIKPELRAMVQYKAFNLLDSMLSIGKCDVIFCRNVLIYFDQETKTRILNNMRPLLPKGGYLFLGASETIIGITEKFKMLPAHRGLYVAD